MNSADFVEEQYIDRLITTQSFASIFLKNGIRLRGYLISQDKETVFLRHAEIQRVYKAKITTINPEFCF